MKLLHNKMVGRHNIVELPNNAAHVTNLWDDLIAAKVSRGIPKQSDWSTMMRKFYINNKLRDTHFPIINFPVGAHNHISDLYPE